MATGTGPLYLRVRRSLDEALRRGEYPANRPIPSNRQLSAMYGVSRSTVDAALQELTALGVLESRPRSGLYPVDVPQHLDRGDDAMTQRVASTAPARPDPGAVDWSSHLLTPSDPWQTKSVSDPDYLDHPYPFLPGQMAPGTFPERAWLRATAQAFDRAHAVYSVRDSADADDPLLVEALIAHVLPSKGIEARPGQVLVTAGVQQALSLLAGALLDPGRTVAMEDPGYVDAARIFHRSGARLQLFPVDSRGVRPDYRSDFDLIYVTPSHQHPTNTTLHADRRRDMLAQAAAKDFLVIEDDFDSEIRFRGAPTAPLRANDPTGRVIYLGTFSKFLAPALRLGYVVAEEAVIAELRERRYLANKHPSGLDQRALALFIASGDFHRVLSRHRTELKRKWEAVSAALEHHLPWPVETVPSGGLSFWIRGPDDFDATAMAARARRLGVLVIPGERYHLRDPAPRNSFRLGFSAIQRARIEPGIALLARAIDETHPSRTRRR